MTGETKKRGELPFMALLGLLGTWVTALPVFYLMPWVTGDPSADSFTLGYLWVVVWTCLIGCPVGALVIALVTKRWNWAAVSAVVLALSPWYAAARDLL